MKILLIGINFFGYDKKIKESLELLGYQVELCYDMPKRYVLPMVLLSEKKIKKINIKYQKKIIKKIEKNDYDKGIVIVGRYLTREFFEKISYYRISKNLILYLWDDVLRVKNFFEVKNYYKEIFSFDSKDCVKYNFKFLPLFYSDDYFSSPANKTLDVFTAFTMHSDRINIINKICIFLAGRKNYFFVKVGKLNFIKLLFEKNNSSIHFSIRALASNQNAELIRKSKCVLDIQHPSQNGLTIRSIEVLQSQTKLITTNENIKDYDFYNEQNILVIDRQNPYIPNDFIDSPFDDSIIPLLAKYSVLEWVKVLLGETFYQYRI